MAYQKGSGFIGLNQYLNANQEQARAMGSNLAGQVEQAGAAAQGAIDAQRQQAEQQIAAGTPTYQGSTYGLEPDEVESLRAAGMARGYSGPEGMGDTGQLAQQALGAQQKAQLAGTDAGRAVLIQQGRASPAAGYTTGQSMLDSFLAGRGGGERLAAASGAYGNLLKYLEGAKSSTAGKAEAAKAETKRVQGQYEAIPRPSYGPAAPSIPPAVGGHPRVDNAKQIEDENAWKARMGIRG